MNEKLDNHEEDVRRQMAEQLAQIQAEMRDYKTSCDDKISEAVSYTHLDVYKRQA